MRIRTIAVIISTVLISYSCASLKTYAIRKDISRIISNSPVFSKYLVGFALYDPLESKWLSEINSDQYFTPASNTKVLTLASWLDLDKDSIPFLLVDRTQNIIKPLGDPTFLHPDFENQTPAYGLLLNLNSDTIHVYYDNNIQQYGPGWAWDDYYFSYQPERTQFPVFGNVVRAQIDDSVYSFSPPFFKGFIDINNERTGRERNYNLFNFSISKYLGDSVNVDIPFITSLELTNTLLSDTLNKTFLTHDIAGNVSWDTVYSYHRVPVLAKMMQRSDNFLAEQLLINARLASGFESQSNYFRYLNSTLFKDLPDSLIWVDGSGLSRYNMITPRSMVSVLEGLYSQMTWEEIRDIFPAGGVSGTIKNWYGAEEPYIFAKTGTLRHNHSLSGYLVTNSGKKLIFSFMNNHYPFGSSKVKSEMQKLLEDIRDNY